MSRRRLTLATYVRRRWRYVGAIVVLLLGALLVLLVTDRGHDPLWEATGAPIDSAAVSPDASAVYTLVREGEAVTRIVAYQGADGTKLWEGEMNATAAVLAAGDDGAAVATDFPFAFLTSYGREGALRWHFPLEGSPVALVKEGDRLALALTAPSLSNPVLLFEGEHLVRTLPHPSPVVALDMEKGLVAAAGRDGDLVVHASDGREVANLSLGFAPLSLRLADDGTSVLVGGRGLAPADPGGHVAFVDLGPEPTLRWRHATPARVGLVDLDAAGLRALAIEESPPSATVHVYDGATGGTLWTYLVEGSVPRDDAGSQGAAALSPDATRVAVGTVGGSIRAFDAASGDLLWGYRAAGATRVMFGDEETQRVVVVGRLLGSRPYDSLMVFSLAGEPLGQSAAVLSALLVALGAATLAAFVGIGFWRARRTY